jgi:hypothetical protein
MSVENVRIGTLLGEERLPVLKVEVGVPLKIVKLETAGLIVNSISLP